jgi:hypothetical protein
LKTEVGKEEKDLCYVGSYRGTDEVEAIDSNSFFEIEMNSQVFNGRFLKWSIEDEEDIFMTFDGFFDNIENSKDNVFRLRHLNSGQHLMVFDDSHGKTSLCLSGIHDMK